MLFVGSFPPTTANVFGGNVSDCAALLGSSFPERVEIVTLDSTQESVPPPSLTRRAILAIRRAFRFLRLVHSRDPDAILLFASSGFSFVEKACYAAYGRLLGIPSLLSIRSGHFLDHCRRSGSFRLIARAFLAAPTLLLCQGERWRRFFQDELRIEADRCKVIENWVATEPLLRIGSSRRRTISSSGVRLLFMGWVETFKGVYELVDSVAALRAQREVPPLELLVAGDGRERDRVDAYARKLGLEDRIRFLGWVKGDAKLALFESSNIFVLPSHTEGLPNAMIEAMAAGLPVVVTPVGSIPDVIDDQRNGIIVPVGDAEALARALRALLLDPNERARLGSAAHGDASTRFTAERASEGLEALIAKAVATSQDSPVRRS